ncbi:helix-turn-helix domain-containing protein [Jiulongibacter sp. NS-SX5]|uniref:helix-turn-helix domain-containing protein n=1 Tax=Jiulongibacter sp. NS-SX5 TaxID=3463854 RepID=UPI0040583DF7
MVRTKGLEKYRVHQGEVFCLPANHITAVEHVSADLKGFYCHFQSEIFNHDQLKVAIEKDFPFFTYTSDPLIKVDQSTLLKNHFEELYHESQKNEPSRTVIVALRLLLILNELKRQTSSSISFKQKAALRLSQRYKEELGKNMYKFKTVAEFADLLNVSPNHLHKCVKETTGLTALQLLQNMRVLEAKVLLKQSTLSISEIGYQLGGYEASDFSRFFKNQTGMSPKTYRKEQN